MRDYADCGLPVAAPNNGYKSNYPSYKGLFCTGDALAAKGLSIGLDIVGTVPGLNDAVGLGTGIVGAGLAVADREDSGVGLASAGAGLALTTGHMAGVGILAAKMVPGIGNLISAGTGIYDAYGAYKAYQACMAGSKYD